MTTIPANQLPTPEQVARVEHLAAQLCGVIRDANANYLDAIAACGSLMTHLLTAVPIQLRLEICQSYLQAIAGDVSGSIPSEGKYDA